MNPLRCPATLVGENGSKVTLDVLVDPSVTFATFPASLLTSVGVKPWHEVKHRSGGYVVMGLVEVVLGSSAADIVRIFGNEDELPLIGSHGVTSL